MTKTLPELATFSQLLHAVASQRAEPDVHGWSMAFVHILEHPLPCDEALLALSKAAELSQFELLSLSLAATVEMDAALAERIARLQAPGGRARPLAGLLAVLFADVLGEVPSLVQLIAGPAARLGLLEFGPATLALPERPVSVPLHICAALYGQDLFPTSTALLTSNVPLPESIRLQAQGYGSALKDGRLETLLIRGTGLEPVAAATSIAARLKRRPVLIPNDPIPALGPWLMSRRLLPVHRYELAPGEHVELPEITGYSGPRLVAASPHGAITVDQQPSVEWRIGLPSPAERLDLWNQALPKHPEFNHEIADPRRYSASRIHQLGKLLSQFMSVEKVKPDAKLLCRAAWIVERQALGHLAMPVEVDTDNIRLILPPELIDNLNRLVGRCRLRDTTASHLGPAAKATFRPGVRSLFSGPPGTGKSLAAAWLAAELQLPLFRIDLATVVSKYIGETEKNLARLFDQAEQSEVVLLFDEADGLFSKRTSVVDSHDRFANAQTNYLLERMESFGGIAILTTNHDANLDEAFERRLDFCLEFPAPSPSERRRLWHSHLGEEHSLSASEINLLAAHLEWSGGHIRNAVLHAAASAKDKLSWGDVLIGIRIEASKLRKSLPFELRISA
jgi:hypothetical protein